MDSPRPKKKNGIVLSKTAFFVLFFLLVLQPFFVPRLLWLIHSIPAKGIYAFHGQGNAGDQIMLDYSVDYFVLKGREFWFNGFGGLDVKPGDSIPVRYRSGDPADARVNVFYAIWGDVLVYTGIPMLMLLCVFVHPGVVPRKGRLLLAARKPFVFIV